jgi:nitric oxide reductase large subunit
MPLEAQPERLSIARVPFDNCSADGQRSGQHFPREANVTVQNAPQVVSSSTVIKRYKDAYRVAAATIALGSTVQALGVVLALIFGAVAFLLGQDGNTALAAAAVGALIVVLILFYVVAVLVRAQGQSLRASLDGAVHSSPFLTDAEKASAMGL